MFDYWITSPIKEGKSYGLKRLQTLIKATCLRRTKKSVNDSLELPSRLEKTEVIELHEYDREIYTFFKEITATIAADSSTRHSGPPKHEDFKESNILSLINFLRLICNHGKDLLAPSALAAWETRGSTSIDWLAMQKLRRCDWCGVEPEVNTKSTTPEFHCEHIICADCVQQNASESVEEAYCPKCARDRSEIAHSSSDSPAWRPVQRSAKVEALLRNLANEQKSRSHSNTESGPKRYDYS